MARDAGLGLGLGPGRGRGRGARTPASGHLVESLDSSTSAYKPRPGRAWSQPNQERRQVWPGTPRNGGAGQPAC